MNIICETNRLILRKIEPEDDRNFFALDSDPQVHKYLGNNTVQSIQQSRETVLSVIQQQKKYGVARWAVIDKSTMTFMGWSGLKYETQLRPEAHYYDLGYRLKPEYWGKGYATESAKAALTYGFKQLGLNKICAAAHEGNMASIAVLLKLGMQPLGNFIYKDIICNWYELNSWQFE